MSLPGERELIAALTAGLDSVRNPRGLTDDCAVLPMGALDLVVSMDTFAAGTHFPAGTPYEMAGRFAVSAALSDLAAAGAEPLGVLVGYGLPRELALTDAKALADGVRHAITTFGGEVLGGDTKPREELTLAVTALGNAPAGQAMGRGFARPGDALIVTGPLGGAAAALARIAEGLTPAEAAPLLEPIPRLRAGTALRTGGVRGATDLSDGLAEGAAVLAAASGVRVVVEEGRVPLHPWAAERKEALELALAGGGDYELLAAVPTRALGDVQRTVERTGAALHVIGHVEQGEGAVLTGSGDARDLSRGFEHPF